MDGWGEAARGFVFGGVCSARHRLNNATYRLRLTLRIARVENDEFYPASPKESRQLAAFDGLIASSIIPKDDAGCGSMSTEVDDIRVLIPNVANEVVWSDRVSGDESDRVAELAPLKLHLQPSHLSFPIP